MYFFFSHAATTEFYPLSLHAVFRSCDALLDREAVRRPAPRRRTTPSRPGAGRRTRSEEHTSELQSLRQLVCRLLLEKKKEGHGIDTGTLPRPRPKHTCQRHHVY